MTLTEEQYTTDTLISEALKKIQGKSEKDLCKFIPSETEGYMHHFTLKKLKNNQPETFRSLIETFIMSPSSPQPIDPKRRQRKNKSLSINSLDLRLILKLAHKTGDKYLLNKIGSKLSYTTLKRELISSIKENRVDGELWQSYTHAAENLKQK